MVEKNKIFYQDVFEYLARIENGSIDLAVVDPPYNQSIDKWDTFASEQEFFDFTFGWIDLVIEKLKDTGSLYIFNNAYNAAIILSYLKEKGMKYKNWIVWYKKDGFSPSRTKYVNNQEVILFFTKTEKYTFNCEKIRTPYLSTDRMKAAAEKGILKNGKRWFPNPEGKLCSDVWEFASERHAKKVNGKVVKTKHPTPKPEALVARIVQASSNEGELILDLFSGSGTTAYVAKKLERQFTGCENNREYYEYILDRLGDRR